MGKHRVRMPYCAYCGRRIKSRRNDWHEFNNALERATLLALHRGEAPFVKPRRDWSSTGIVTYPDRGWVLTLKRRGLWNVFCRSQCAWAWLQVHLPSEEWESWPPSP